MLAASYQQLAASGGTRMDPPNVNYVTGRQITVNFKDRQVQTVTVREHATGWYLEAATDSSRRSAKDSTTTKAPPPRQAGDKRP